MAGKKQPTNGLVLALGMGVLGALLALAPVLAGGLYVTQHEGDTLHLADLVLRMSEAGQIPHLDFMTPIGIGALWPIALFSKMGLGLGHAFFAAQAALAALLFWPLWRTAISRFPGGLAWLFVVYGLGLCLALVHGEARAATSVSMHYNRWAWALTYIVVPLAMLEPLTGRRPALDGALIGLAMAGMALIKVTYFVAFAPAVIVALLVRRDFRALGVALLAGLAVAGAMTLLMGLDFWRAYLQDLLTVAGSQTRAAPGEAFGGILAAPQYVTGTLLLLMTVIFLRQAEALSEGLVLLILTPAFAYVTYQNYGNDPQWLMLLGLLALSLRPESLISNALGWRLRDALMVTGVGALILAAGPAVNLVWSPLRHAFTEIENTVPYLSQRPSDGDIFVQAPRVYKVTQTVSGVAPGQPFAAFAEKGASKKPEEPTVLNGERLPECELATGFNAWFETAAGDLVRGGYGGSVLVADLFTALWLYGPFEPVKGAAPWYYGGAPGIDAADHVLVPLCPTSKSRRAEIVEAIDKAGWALVEETRTRTFILLRPQRIAAGG
ncbi:hypothetical protein CKO11_16140 [Rhodobacter sp. TJ_12]|uniref:DUF2029 domain-containing protein n=1 Tax=Rhodobacter sp. TJ_12 TaxID=2029399 RepID=UPI001CBC48F2|nr:DUF2029 domain-containing protein [Rhodobacter sp. TJ_12]MBZ4023982.1 hypothetical protein [Rhodobacter sp. TJ_12]